MASHQVKDKLNKKLIKMAQIVNKKPSLLLEQIIEDHYSDFLRKNKLKDL